MATKIIVLGIYVAILFLIGILASLRVKSMSDYYLGGKKMGFWAVAFSARATGVAPLAESIEISPTQIGLTEGLRLTLGKAFTFVSKEIEEVQPKSSIPKIV